ncbi:MAG: porin family protein [Prevotella sp.]|nr:porin family protein [Prevotella sp.]
MKKLLFTLAITLATISASAQKGVKTVGANVSYGTEIKNIGIGVKGQYGITDAIRGEASLDYFFKNDGMSMWDVNLNVHYLFPITEKIKVYPLAGLTFTNWRYEIAWDFEDAFEGWYLDEEDYEDIKGKESYTESEFGINLGGGIQYDITDKLTINAEAKYQIISNYNQLVLGIGVAYKF